MQLKTEKKLTTIMTSQSPDCRSPPLEEPFQKSADLRPPPRHRRPAHSLPLLSAVFLWIQMLELQLVSELIVGLFVL